MHPVRLLLPAVLLLAAAASARDRPPNFLVIIAGDVTCNDLPLYGGTNIETPNIDRLASQGLTFNQAYLSMAMCNPCRTELYTASTLSAAVLAGIIQRPGLRNEPAFLAA